MARLKHQVLLDSLLLFVPPVAVLVYLLMLLYRAGWLSATAVLWSASLVMVLTIVAIWWRGRPRAPSARLAARLVDERSGAKDHFLTLATIDPANQPAAFVARVREQAETFVDGVELKRDFPYRPKRSAYLWLGGSLVLAVLIHLLLPLVLPRTGVAAVADRLRQLARQMAADPALRALSKELEAVAARLEDPTLSEEQKGALAEQLEEKIREQQKLQQQTDDRNLLARASDALAGRDQQPGASGQEQREQQKGSGGIESNAPEEGRDGKQQSQGDGGDGKGKSSARLNQGQDQGGSATSNPKERGPEKSPSSAVKGETKNNQNQPDPNQRSDEPDKEKAAKNQGGSKEGAGKQQASDEPPPQGKSPVERFYKAGEGKEGLKGAGYVTVQLPEELVADTEGERRATKESRGRQRAQVPVSNVPLPAHVPNAPTEKQPLPIEYRGVIR
jgi:hypothetical protein